MVSAEFSICISEILDILKHMEKSYLEKIPKKFQKFLEDNKSIYYVSNLDHSKPINEMELKAKTKSILAVIYMNYWCTNEEKEDYIKLLQANEKKYQEELREKYNPDNIFKNITKEPILNENISKNTAIMINNKESFLRKIINKIIVYFKSKYN